MIRQNIIINDYVYITDLYKSNIDFTEIVYKKFIMLKNYNVLDGVIYDKDIYFIDKEILNNAITDFDNNGTGNKIVFPITNTKFSLFSNSYIKFNSNYNKFSFEKTKTDQYILYDSTTCDNEASIQCDKIKIYHPNNKTNIDSIIYLDFYSNDIHFHLFCSRTDALDYGVDTEFKINNIIYSEYIEFYIPNIEYLFRKNNIYYKEAFNKFNISDNDKSVYYSDLYSLLRPFKISNQSSIIKEKIIYDYITDITNNYLTIPINITIYPYDSIDTNIHQYILSSTYVANSDTFTTEYIFRLSAKLGFDNGIISVINKFIYPNQLCNTVYDAYKYYFLNNSSVENIQNVYADFPYIKIDDNYNTVKSYYSEGATLYKHNSEFNTFDTIDINDISKYSDIYVNIYDDDYDDIFPEIKSVGFHIQISTDTNFKNIIYDYFVKTEFNTKEYPNISNIIDDYAFQLNNIFEKWEQLPELLVIRTQFIDKVLNNIITSNDVVITKEYFKYFINNSNINRLMYLANNQKEYNNTDMDMNNFNFIDKINCTINKVYTTNNNTNLSVSNTPKILYKPIFYKVQPLQNIKIKAKLVQNIGINLANYMTKVETFKMLIDNHEFIESSRNDIYVIFKINPSDFTYTDGTYNIVNENDEFISDGKYIIYE